MTINSSNNDPFQFTLFGILTYRSTLVQKQQLDHILNQWAETASFGEDRIEAKKRILDFFNNSTHQRLNLSSLNLSSLPDIFHIACFCHRLKQLDLSENQLTTLPDTFGKLSRLVQLCLNTNQLTTLPDTFGKLSQLTWLCLNMNRLTTLPDTFGKLSRLTMLDLSTNQLKALPDTFTKLSRLTELNLSANQLTTLPDTFTKLSQLTWLGLSANQLTTLPETFGKLSQLIWLGLNTNQLTVLPDTFDKLSRLTQLGLSTNQLTTLPETFGKLSQLRQLGLNTNRLTTLPDTFGKLSQLTWLDLGINQLTTLPETFGKLTQLTQLGLSANRFTTLPDTFGKLSRLTMLDLSMNQLKTLPDTFGKLSRLTALALNANQLTTLPGTFGKLYRLAQLELNTNRLTTLPDTFGKLSQLTWLGLNANQLTTLPETFGKLSKLTWLDLGINQLTTLPETFGKLSQLTQLGLSANRFTTLPDTLANLSQLKILELSNNYSLTEIPMKILELPKESRVILKGNRNMDPMILQSLLTIIARFDYKGPKVIFHHTIKEFVVMMYQVIQKPPREFFQLEESKDVYLWLQRLFDIADFKKGGELQKELMTLVINYLTEANDNPEFRVTFDTIIRDAVGTCGDRMALSIINLGVAHQLANVSFTNMYALADLLKGLWAINLLETIAENKISVLRAEPEDPDQLVDEVEIYLGYLIKLKEDLHLPVNMQNMLFFDCSQLTSDDLEEAKAFILSQQSHQKAYFAFLNHHDKWIAALSTHYQEEYRVIVDAREHSANLENPDYVAIEENFNKQLEALTEKALSKRV